MAAGGAVLAEQVALSNGGVGARHIWQHACSPPCPSLPALQVRTGLGCLPADFDSVVRAAGVAHTASNLARWEAYAVAHMFDPSTAKL